MPSGAKKRKAAKRKLKHQQSVNINSDPASDPHPRGNGAVHVHHPASRKCSDHNPPDEEPEAGKKGSISENGKKEPADAVVDIGAKQMQGEVQVESVQPMEDALKETGMEKSGSEAVAVINILHSDLANEEAMPASEAITETSEATVHPPNNVAETENLELLRVTETPAAAVSIELETFETAVSTELHETEAAETALTTEATRAGTPETAATTENDIPASLMHHRTRWWNCCGLFDVISG